MGPDDSPGLRVAQRPYLCLLVIIATVLVGWALHAMSVVFIPVVCSLFIALLVFPVDRWVAERMPDRLRWVGHVAALGVILAVIGVFFGSVWLAAERVESRFPETFPDLDEAIQEQATQLSPGTSDGAAAPEAEEGPEAGQGAGSQSAGEGQSASGGLLSQLTRAFEQVQGLLGQYGLDLARTCLARPEPSSAASS